MRQAQEISLEEAQRRMDEEIALWLREEEILQEALQESKREGIGKIQEQVTPLSRKSNPRSLVVIPTRWSTPSWPPRISTKCYKSLQRQARRKSGNLTGKPPIL